MRGRVRELFIALGTNSLRGELQKWNDLLDRKFGDRLTADNKQTEAARLKAFSRRLESFLKAHGRTGDEAYAPPLGELEAALRTESAPAPLLPESPTTGTDPAVTIEQFERDTPALDKRNDTWLKSGNSRMRSEASVASLKALRNAFAVGAEKTPDVLFGVDKSGRRWREESAQSTVVY